MRRIVVRRWICFVRGMIIEQGIVPAVMRAWALPWRMENVFHDL